MRWARGLLVAALALPLAVGAYAQMQDRLGSGGLIPGPAGEAVKGSSSPKFMEGTYFVGGGLIGATDGDLVGGWYCKEASDIFDNAAPMVPGINVQINQATGQRGGWWERGIKYGTLNLTHDEAQNYRFSVVDFDAIGSMDTDGVIYICIGDSAFTTVDRTPDGFGVMAVGTNEDWAGGPVAEEWTAFVGDGTDTTYAPMGADITDSNLFEIYAAPDGGPVEFWLNGTLAASISDPVRSSNADLEGISIWIQNDTDDFWGTLHIGSLWWQREFD